MLSMMAHQYSSFGFSLRISSCESQWRNATIFTYVTTSKPIEF